MLTPNTTFDQDPESGKRLKKLNGHTAIVNSMQVPSATGSDFPGRDLAFRSTKGWKMSWSCLVAQVADGRKVISVGSWFG